MKSIASTLPKFPTDWPEYRFDPENPKHQKLLANIQAGILRDHGREHGLLIFFSFTPKEEQRNRAALRAAADLVTSALDQYRAARRQKQNPRTHVATVALSFTGFQRCGATPPSGQDYFEQGMRNKKVAGELVDPAKEELDEPFKSLGRSVDGVWVLACDSVRELRRAASRIKDWAKEFEISMVGKPQPCGRWRPGKRVGGEVPAAREPFGFVDGISSPRVFKGDERNHRSINYPIGQILIADDKKHRGGSFLVVRKLEQNVRGFRQFEARMKDALHCAGKDPELAAALLIGRKREGQPLVRWHHGARDLNDFSFAHDPKSHVCPFDAHIRKVNPRFPSDGRGIDEAEQVATQFARRSMVYGVERLTLKGPHWPKGNVGLWFMAYMRDIENQFKRMQIEWMKSRILPVQTNNPNVSRYTDILLYGGRAMGKNPPPAEIEWKWRGASCPGLAQFVRFKGGEFFFAPSKHWLVGTGNAPSRRRLAGAGDE